MANFIIEPNKTRRDLAKSFFDRGFTHGAEIGVEQGEYSEILLEENPKLYLNLVDAWKTYPGYNDFTRQSKLDRFYESTKNRLHKYSNRVMYYHMFSIDASKNFSDESLDFVYIDANHDFYHFTQDLYLWSKKVRPGGIIAGHDFLSPEEKSKAPHVQVAEVLEGYNIDYVYICGDVNDEIRDDYRSWYFIKS